jgi:bacteriocin biosynthesis cyclodehydratase domain-containing protein
MMLRLDQRLPVVWRSPTSLQFGVNNPRLRLDDLDLASENMVAALGSGVTRSGLVVIARSAGADESVVDSLLRRLEPVMEPEIEASPRRVVVSGTGRLAERVATMLAESGLTVFVARSVDAAERQDCELAIAIGHFVLEPGLLGVWLRRDLPHLPVLLGDTTVVVGPMVEPGNGPCLHCLHRHATDADSAWPAIATQLWGRRSPADSELMASEVGAVVARTVLARLAGEPGDSRQLLVGTDGSRAWQELDVHPDCGCVAPGAANAEARRESDSAFSPAPPPKRGAVGVARA